jgi:hypothetical protein
MLLYCIYTIQYFINIRDILIKPNKQHFPLQPFLIYSAFQLRHFGLLILLPFGMQYLLLSIRTEQGLIYRISICFERLFLF